MYKTVAVVFLGRLGVANAGACDPVDSCVQLSDGLYCPVNNVQEHADINKDVAAISTKLKETPPNYAAAKTIYTDGQESSKGPGNMRKLQSLAKKDMTSAGYTNAWYTGTVDVYGGDPSSPDNIWDKWILACLDGTGDCNGKSDNFRKYVINKMCIGVVTGYSAYEMGVAIKKAADGLTADGEAAYYWDEAAAFYIGNIAPLVGDGVTGSPTSNLYSPYEFNWKRDNDYTDGTNTHAQAIKILNYGLLNLRGASNYDASNVAAARTAMDKVFAIAAIRSAIKYSWKAVDDEKYVAEGAAYWRTGAGYISTVSTAVKTLVEEVNALFDMTAGGTLAATVPCQVKTKVEAMYKDLGITCEMVGTWKDMPDTSTCKTCDDNSATGSLLAGSDAYVDMCKATESPTPAPSPTADPGAVSAAPSAHDRSGYCGVPALAVAASWAA